MSFPVRKRKRGPGTSDRRRPRCFLGLLAEIPYLGPPHGARPGAFDALKPGGLGVVIKSSRHYMTTRSVGKPETG
jgi:hypothetical protein